MHGILVLVVYYLYEVLEFRTDVLHMVLCAGVEEDFAKQGVVFLQNSACYLVMPFEGGTRGILVLHYGREDEGAHEGHG